MKFISIDPSMSNTAIVWGNINKDKTISLIDYKVIHTEKSSDKKVPVMVDRLNRIRDLFSVVDEVIISFPPDFCFGELPSGSQSSTASVGIGVSLAVLAKLPNLVDVTPMDVKKVIGGGIITKDQIMDYCLNKYPDFNFEKKKDGTLVKARMEHLCDSIVIAEAGIKKLNKR